MTARRILVVALAIACQGALAQTEVSIVPAPLAVQRLAPQLVTFAGSDANFQNLVNGLSNGSQVQLVSTLPNGFSQLVTFTPTAIGSPAQIAQILESARQQLIGLGIAAPTAEQIGFVLMGGLVPTALGGTQVSGLINGTGATNPASPAARMQQQAASGATSPTATSSTTATNASVTNAVNVTTTPTAATPTTTVATPRQTSDSLAAPGATSRTPLPLTSASPVLGTSATPTVTAPVATSPAPVPGNGAPAAATRLSR